MASPYGYHVIRVLLTGTDNLYLTNRLPLRGELTVHEMNTQGHPMPRKVTFRAERPDGTLEASVHVDNPSYSYISPTGTDGLITNYDLDLWETGAVDVGKRNAAPYLRPVAPKFRRVVIREAQATCVLVESMNFSIAVRDAARNYPKTPYLEALEKRQATAATEQAAYLEALRKF